MADTVPSNYYYGHGGPLYLGTRTSLGAVSNFDIVLNEVDELSFTIEQDKLEHISRRESIAAKDLSVVRMMGLTGKIIVAEHTADLLKVYLFGVKGAVAGGSFSAIAFPSGVVAGDRLPIGGGRSGISSLIITDSAGTPATLVLGTDYEVDLAAGIVRFVNVTGFTQPFKAAGTEAAGNKVGMVTQRVYERYLRFKSINIADGDKVSVIDIPRVQIDPAASWTLLNNGNEVNTYEINFTALKDPTIDPASTYGQYGFLVERT